jgi:DNA-binding transcriptional LysR family regulator
MPAPRAGNTSLNSNPISCCSVVILLPEEVAAEDLAADRLRRILPDWQAKSTPVYALTETRLLPAKTQRFIEFLQERLGQQAGARKM